jgi:uncharacterized protein (TIGR02466 family)
MSLTYTSHNLFPSKIVTSRDEKFSYRDDLIEWMYNYRKNDTTGGVVVSNIYGYQSEGNFYKKDDSFKPFMEEIWSHITSTIDRYGEGIELGECISNGYKILLKNIWFNINPPKAYNHVHIHPGCLLSGVLWVKTQADCGDLILRDPLEMNSYCLGENGRGFVPADGVMLLFPAHIPHNVVHNLSKEDRISISFNLDLIS